MSLLSPIPVSTGAVGITAVTDTAGGRYLRDGEACRDGDDCQSTYCYPVPGDGNYCFNRDANCPRPGTWGVMYGERFFWKGRRYECREGVGLVSHSR